MDRSRYGVAVADHVDSRVSVWSAGFRSLHESLQQLYTWEPATVLAGKSIKAEAEGPWLVEPAALAETSWATPTLLDVVARGRLAHNHDATTAAEVDHARVSERETGPLLSARQSGGPVPTVKAVAWATWAAALDGRFAVVEPEIW